MEEKKLSAVKDDERAAMEDKELHECMDRLRFCEHAPGIVYGESIKEEEMIETGVVIVYLFIVLGIIALFALTYFIFYF